ncbi:MAG: gluconate 2-dehydrogenase subunit 3 family protein [Terracidiphilus sp.]
MRRPASKIVLTRRQFALAGALSGAAAVIGCHDGTGAAWDFLSDSRARTLSALCDQIIPADAFPGASQAGVVIYIDSQLARHYRRHRDTYGVGLAQVDAISRNQFGHAFADATPPQQFQIVTALEKENRVFFELLRQHTMEGYYGSPRHGGNRDAVSWRMLGLAEPPIRGRAQYDLRSTASPRNKGDGS